MEIVKVNADIGQNATLVSYFYAVNGRVSIRMKRLVYSVVSLNCAFKYFRENVLSNLSDKTFDKPICEVLLNQKYFNGIGNYLRAEILFR